MKEHNFKRTNRKKKGLTIFKCNDCDSECIFKATRTEREVNEYVTKIYPLMFCVPSKTN